MATVRGADEDLWGITGLLHDMDYERWMGHPRMAIADLERRDYPPQMIRAIATHADALGVSRDSDLESRSSRSTSCRGSSSPVRTCARRASTA